MHSEVKDEYVILKPDSQGAKEEDNTLELFFSELKEKISTFSSSNLILDFSEIVNTDVTKILLFSPLSGKHKDRNKSFVIVSEGINVEEIPEDLGVVPTLQEAIDIVEMENIERDLGI
jgi:hypothetical protein